MMNVSSAPLLMKYDAVETSTKCLLFHQFWRSRSQTWVDGSCHMPTKSMACLQESDSCHNLPSKESFLGQWKSTSTLNLAIKSGPSFLNNLMMFCIACLHFPETPKCLYGQRLLQNSHCHHIGDLSSLELSPSPPSKYSSICFLSYLCWTYLDRQVYGALPLPSVLHYQIALHKHWGLHIATI